MKAKRGIFAALLTLILLLGVLTVQAFALDSEVPAPTYETGTYINPLYADVVSEEDIMPPMAVMSIDDTVYSNISKAAAAMADAMVNRTANITITWESATKLDDPAVMLFDKAMAHNGKPGYGDNLRFQYAGGSWIANCTPQGDGYVYSVQSSMAYMTTAAQEKKLDAAVDDLLASLSLTGKSDAQKILIVHDWMCNNIAYDYDGLEAGDQLVYTAYKALMNKTAVCQGYANLFYRLMMELGIDCRIISGYANGPHAWNIVEVEDKYYYVDTTWDVSWEYVYFLKGSTNFTTDHTPDSIYTSKSFLAEHPISAKDYVMPVASGKCGSKATWQLDNTGTLTIGGSGAMTDFGSYSDQPWRNYYMLMDKVVVGNSITRVGDKAFQGLYFTDAVVGKAVTAIGTNSFAACNDLQTVTLPAGLSTLEFCAFYNCSSLQKVYYCGTQTQWETLAAKADYYNDSLFAAQRVQHNYANNTCVVCGKTKDFAITTQPKDVTVAAGQTAKVTVKVTGEGLKYEWYYANAGSSKFSKTDSFKGASYSVEMTSARNGRRVYCKITDKYGDSVTTNTVTLKQGTTLTITTQPKNVTVASGKTAKVTVAAKGDGLKYEWYYANAGSSKFSKTSTFTGTSYSVTMSSARSGRRVYCKITDKYGKSVTTNTVTLKQGSALSITTQPKNVTVAAGQKATVTVKAAGEGLKYTWYYKNPGASTFKKTDSFKSNTYSISSMDSARSGRQVYCKITDKYGNSVTTDTVTIKKGTTLTITTQPKNVTVASGQTAKVTIKVKGDGLKYTWYYANKGATKFTKTDSFTGTSYSVTMSSARNGRRVYCKITDKYGKSVTTETVTLKQGTTLAITTQPKDVKAPSGQTAKVTVKVKGDGLKYEWYYANKGATKFTKTDSFTGTSYSVTMTSARDGRRVYCKITDKYGKTVTTETVTLRMQTIYLNKSGTKYHYDKDCAGKTAYASTLAKAKDAGRGPCSKCVG